MLLVEFKKYDRKHAIFKRNHDFGNFEPLRENQDSKMFNKRFDFVKLISKGNF